MLLNGYNLNDFDYYLVTYNSHSSSSGTYNVYGFKNARFFLNPDNYYYSSVKVLDLSQDFTFTGISYLVRDNGSNRTISTFDLSSVSSTSSFQNVIWAYGTNTFYDGTENIAIVCNERRDDIWVPVYPEPSTDDFSVFPNNNSSLFDEDGNLLSPIRNLLDTSSENLFGLAVQGDKLDSVINNNIANPNDSTGGLLTKITNTIQQGFSGITNFLKNYFSNLQLLLQNIVNNVKNQFNDLKSYISSVVNVFNDFYKLGLQDEEFSFFTAIRRLIIPDDLSEFSSRLSQFIHDINSYNGAVLYINTLKDFYNAIKSQNVPTFTVASFNLGAFFTVVDLCFLVFP